MTFFTARLRKRTNSLKLRNAAALVITLCSTPLIFAQQYSVPLLDAKNQVERQRETSEIEVVETSESGAAPSVMRRHSGKFILLLINRTHNRQATFVLDPAAIADGALSPEPLLQWGASGGWTSKDAAARLLDLPPGEYHLKAVPTGKALCKIIVE
jgi:hypothetical protein